MKGKQVIYLECNKCADLDVVEKSGPYIGGPCNVDGCWGKYWQTEEDK